MSTLTLSDWASFAQIAATLLAAVGIAVSIYIGVKTLREIQRDRLLRHKPFLAFEYGGHRINVLFRGRGHTLPGINPAYAKKVLSHLPEDGLSVEIAPRILEQGLKSPNFYGRLKNYGSGTALAARVTYVAEEIWVGDERFALNDAKRAEPLYSHELNGLPTSPSHIEPGQVGQLSRLPAFIVKDYQRKIARVEGCFLITCTDVFGKQHLAKQRFHLFTQYGGEQPTVHVTFSETLDPAAA